MLYHQSATAWASDTAGATVGRALMQSDGDFVVLNGAGARQCSSNTGGSIGAFIVLKNNGAVVIYDANGAPLRSSPGIDSICQPVP